MITSFDQLLHGARSAPAERRALTVGGRRAQVSLMPAEVLSDAQGRRIRGGLSAAVFGVVALTVSAVLFAGQAAGDADARSAIATQQLTTASAALAKFKDVSELQDQLTLLTAADRVGSSTAIDWQRQLGVIEGELPAGLTVTAVKADSATPEADYPQGTTPIDTKRVATVQISGTTSSLAGLPAWLAALKALPSFADATPTVTDGTNGTYEVQVVIHLSLRAYQTSLTGKR